MGQPLIPISPKQAYLYAAFLVLYEFLTYVANDMIMPGMIHVVNGFGAPNSYIATSLSAYILGGASLQLLLGPLSDRFGRRPVMLFGVILFLLCTIFIALSNSIHQFILARFFQGMGLCFIGVIGYATLQEIFAEKDAVKLIAIMANVSILAPLAGPLAGSIFIHFFNWRYIFVSIAVLSLGALFGLWRWMPESVGQRKKDGNIIAPIPFSRKTILKNYYTLLVAPGFMFGSLSLGVLMVPCICWIGLSPLILMSTAKLTLFEYALWQVPVFGASIMGNWILHYLTKYYSLRQIMAIGSVVLIVGLLLASALPALIGTYYLWFMPGIILYFLAMGMVVAPLSRMVLFVTPVAKGTASAGMTLIEMCVLALGLEKTNTHFLQVGNLGFAHSNGVSLCIFTLCIALTFKYTKVKH